MSTSLPPDLCPLETQVAGHTFEGQLSKVGMLRDESGAFVYKPLLKPICAEREILFYQTTKETENDSSKELSRFLPAYEGHFDLPVSGKKQSFVKLENLTYLMNKPCVMDIKIGKRTWDPLATPEKIEVEEQKYAACKNNIGLCIPGFQVYNEMGECLKFGKEHGKGLNENTFLDTMIMFLNAQTMCYKPFVKAIINQLYHLQKWFTDQTSSNFYSSSILIAYDYDALVNEIRSSEGRSSDPESSRTQKNMFAPPRFPWVKVKMIDFAHVFSAEKQSCDANYLFGLQNLISILQQILIDK